MERRAESPRQYDVFKRYPIAVLQLATAEYTETGPLMVVYIFTQPCVALQTTWTGLSRRNEMKTELSDSYAPLELLPLQGKMVTVFEYYVFR